MRLSEKKEKEALFSLVIVNEQGVMSTELGGLQFSREILSFSLSFSQKENSHFISYYTM